MCLVGDRRAGRPAPAAGRPLRRPLGAAGRLVRARPGDDRRPVLSSAPSAWPVRSQRSSARRSSSLGLSPIAFLLGAARRAACALGRRRPLARAAQPTRRPASFATPSPVRCATRRSSSPTGCPSSRRYADLDGRAGRAAGAGRPAGDDADRAGGRARRRARCTTRRCATSPSCSTASPRPPRSRSRTRACRSSCGRAWRSCAARGRASSRPATSERQRLERNLHDGAQQRLVALSLELSLLERQLARRRRGPRAVERARREIAASLRGAARDRPRHPPGRPQRPRPGGRARAAGGAGAASRSGSTVELDERLPEAVEVAAYYLVSREPRQRRQARAGDRRDGRRGARRRRRRASRSSTTASAAPTRERGSGLRGLADRVEALGGRLRVWSAAGGGTRVRGGDPVRVAIAEDSVLLREGLAQPARRRRLRGRRPAATTPTTCCCKVAQLPARRRHRRHPPAADAHRRGPARRARDPRAAPGGRRARAVAVRRARARDEAARGLRRGRRLPAQGPDQRRRRVRRRGAPGRRRRLGARPDHRLHAALAAAARRPARRADAARARGARADGRRAARTRGSPTRW